MPLLTFYKYQGTGNDFIIFDNRNNEIPTLQTQQINKLCNRNFGIGADGLMLLNKKDGVDFEMKYYNADGNESSMCGNGGRCLVKFAHQMGIHKTAYLFSAIDGLHQAEMEEHDIIRLKMQDVNKVELHTTHCVLNTGSPHYVKFVTQLNELDVATEGKEIRYSKEYKAKGININFVESTKQDGIFVRTYERGVEAETLSCGTGVTAAALVSAHNENGFNRIEVKTLGGHLGVEFEKRGEQQFENIWLCGPAKFVYTGQIEM
jgi:diaminopimelate epimerase